MKLSALLSRFDFQRAGSGWIAFCPAHENNDTPSLSIFRDSTDARRLHVNCFGNDCSAAAITSAVGLSPVDLHGVTIDVLDAPQASTQVNYQAPPDLAHQRAIRDRAVATLADHREAREYLTGRWGPDATTRLDLGADRTDAYFPLVNPDGDPIGHQWRSLLPADELARLDLPRWSTPFGADAGWTVGFICKPSGEGPVFITEGPADATTAALLGFDALAVLGAQNTRHLAHVAEWLRGRDLVVVGDNDSAGADFNRKATTQLRAVASSIRALPVPSRLGPRADLTDWRADAGDLFAGEVAEALDGTTEDPPALAAEVRTLAQLRAAPKPVPMIANTFNERSLVMLTGRPGSFKSFLAIDWGASIATGTPWLGNPTRQGTVLYVAAEGHAGIVQRADAWQSARNQTADSFLVLPRALQLGDPADVELLTEYVQTQGVSLVIIDTLSRSTLGTEENSARDTALIVDAAEQVKRAMDATGGSVLLVHHSGKSGQVSRGSSVYEGAADAVFTISREDESLALLRNPKQKDGAEASDIELEARPVGDSLVLGEWGDNEMDAEQVLSKEALLLKRDNEAWLLWAPMFWNTGAKGSELRDTYKAAFGANSQNGAYEHISRLREKGVLEPVDPDARYFSYRFRLDLAVPAGLPEFVPPLRLPVTPPASAQEAADWSPEDLV